MTQPKASDRANQEFSLNRDAAQTRKQRDSEYTHFPRARGLQTTGFSESCHR
jgi:hypothetical protein